MQDFEKLGSFYLGKIRNADGATAEDQLLLYDAKDLTTHALCVGMTGSGKTGLCIGLLEEAAIDNIPAIVIDPKGDIGNLLLTFPELRAEDFRPWVDDAEAARKGMSTDAFAAATADTWRKGLAAWGQDGARIAMLRNAVDLAIYTPGSSAGLPLSVLRSFSAPPAEQRADLDTLRDRILSTVSGLLALIGIDADPIQSREHILLSNILDSAWREGKDMEIADVIRAILAPPFSQLGVFDLESFYPEKDRRTLAMQLNNMLASPGFAAWMQGEALDIGRLLYTAEGRPRVSILSIAHLSDAERMFFVTIVLNELVTWMRRQAGTSSLRAILYMDEIFGYFPPTANPPSKTPMLTLLKQARAFGVGCVLATQNPVDLDYKGLGNTGTWFIGRLQTERDKLRVLDGLEGASSAAGKSFDRAKLDATLSGLGKRVFLLNNVHDDAPVLFETRWAMSYLRGPLTRSQIEILMAEKKLVGGTGSVARAAVESSSGADTSEATPMPSPSAAASAASVTGTAAGARPVLPSGLDEYFFPAAASAGEITYRPQLLVKARVHHVHAKSRLDDWQTMSMLLPLDDGGGEPLWEQGMRFDDDLPGSDSPADAAAFSGLPTALGDAKLVASWQKQFASWLYQHETIALWSCPELKAISEAGESEGEFRIRLSDMLREQRDAEMEKLRGKYLPKFSRVQERIRKAEQRVAKEEAQYRDQGMAAAVDVGATLLGALFGRRVSAGSAVRRTASRVGRASSERGDIARAQADLTAAQSELAKLEDQFRDEASRLKAMDASTFTLEEISVAPRKSDISVSPFTLAWMPWHATDEGLLEPAWEGA
ncbi:MAG: ATP-binding protein [Bacteroidetes bacterium]|nr:ATP-binding protein [Bacteroidota bacterium]